MKVPPVASPELLLDGVGHFVSVRVLHRGVFCLHLVFDNPLVQLTYFNGRYTSVGYAKLTEDEPLYPLVLLMPVLTYESLEGDGHIHEIRLGCVMEEREVFICWDLEARCHADRMTEDANLALSVEPEDSTEPESYVFKDDIVRFDLLG